MPRRYEVDPQGPFYLGDSDLASLTLFAQTAAETSTGTTANTAYLPFFYDVRRAGVVPNSASAASANTAALKTLFDPTKSGPTGVFIFPNTTGADIYYFNDWIPCRDGVRLNICGSTLNCTKTVLSAYDSFAGFLMGIRDFSVENGTIVFSYSGGGGSISVIQIGARGSECGNGAYFPNTYDSLLARPQGNCYLRNLRITSSNNTNGLLIQMTGGLFDVTLEDIHCDGGGVGDGVDYEFGWATSGTTNLRQTAHAKNLNIRNLTVRNINTTYGCGLTLAGSYNHSVDGLCVTSAASVFVATTGESLNYRPWSGVDTGGAKRTKIQRNLNGESISGTGITLTGAQLASGGYLSAIIAALSATNQALAQTDLADYELNGFSLKGPSAGFGVLFSGGVTRILNGTVDGFEEAIVGTDEGTRFLIENVNAINSTQAGMRFTVGSAIWGTTRRKTGIIRGCYIAGNSTSSAGTYPGIDLNYASNVLIETNRIGKEAVYDGAAETTQGNAVQLSANCSNVVCDNNYVGSVFGASFAYYNVTSSPPSNGNTVRNPGGITTTSGAWDEVLQAATPVLTCATPGNLAVTYSAQVMEYIKTGNRIDYAIRIQTAAFTYTTATGILKITGLPYTVNSGTWEHTASLEFSGITKAGYTQFVPYAARGQTYMGIVSCGTGIGLNDVNITDFPTGGAVTLRLSGTYFV